MRHICRLPCLEKLNLEGNPVTIVVDYRNKIFELFGDRAKEVSFLQHGLSDIHNVREF